MAVSSGRLLAFSALALAFAGCSGAGQAPSLGIPTSEQLEPTLGQLQRAALARRSTFGSIEEFRVPHCGNNCQPIGISLGYDGQVWFANFLNGYIDEIDTSGYFTEHSVGAMTVDVTEGPQHGMWFTAPGQGGSSGQIGFLSSSGMLSFFPGAGSPDLIAKGPGPEIWFTNIWGSIDSLTPAGTLTSYPLANGMTPEGLVRGPDGNMWFTEVTFDPGVPDAVAKITPSGQITQYSLPQGVSVGAITVGPDEQLWFLAGSNDTTQGMLGRCTLGGQITMYPIPSQGLYGIARGPAHDLYFTEITGAIGRVTLRNGIKVTEYSVPGDNPNPLGIVEGADRNMWFTVPDAGLIGLFHTH